MKLHSYFSGIGGFDFAARRLGIETSLLVEKDKFCIKFLKYYFQNVQLIDDIKKVDSNIIDNADVAVAGFPCQDISLAGNIQGIFGSRSSLVFNFLQLCYEKKYRYVLLENSPNLYGNGLREILCTFVEMGYDAQWCYLCNSDFGYMHKRKRIYIVANPGENRFKTKLHQYIKTEFIQRKTSKIDDYGITEKRIYTVGNYWDICGANGFQRNFRKLIGTFGNAVNVDVAEFLLRYIMLIELERKQIEKL